MKAARLFNRLAKLDRAKLKTGDTGGLYWMLKSVRHGLAEVGKVLLERYRSVIPDQARKLCRWAHDSIEVLQKYAWMRLSQITRVRPVIFLHSRVETSEYALYELVL